ncbi:minor tail protein [Pantoea phage AH01]|nr:minor tail protein [Pantoea phage AH01]
MAITHHLARNAEGGFDRKKYRMSPMEFVIKHIPDGTPFQIYIEAIGEENDVTEDFESLKEGAEFFVVESVGGGFTDSFAFKLFVDPLGVTKFIQKLISPQAATSGIASNQQGQSPNNSLTDRSNKPRPYERTYDICGTVQSIPNDLMTVYKKYDAAGNVIEYGYYDVGRGPLDTPISGITDGDTLLAEIGGSSAAVYAPYTSPNSGHSPQVQIGSLITENLYITAVSNEVDGAELKANNELNAATADSSYATRIGTTGTITDPTGDSGFSDYMSAGDSVRLFNIKTDPASLPGEIDLSGDYVVLSVSGVDISIDVSTNMGVWAAITSSGAQLKPNTGSIGPVNFVEKSFTDWFTISLVKSKRVVANYGASSGMYRDSGKSAKQRASVDILLQYQAVDDSGAPYGPVYESTGNISGRSSDQTGVTIIGELPVESAFRARTRRLTNKDFDFNGQVVDSVSFDNLYGQTPDYTNNYGNRTTIHTARRQTPRATSIKSPKLALVVTEKIYRYLGGGVFDTNLTNNTQAIQSLIRLLRDPVCGNLNLSNENMDRLIAVQNEVEFYFGSALAGQFCYTFDSYDVTMQDMISIISDAIFCKPYREGSAILLDFDRPRLGPEMVFTHRSKAPGEKWTRNFNTKDRYDSLKFSYIDPKTNIKETITIPATGGLKTETFDSKGIRNYQQAYWSAYRRFQRNNLNRVAVEFTAMEEGVFARPGRAISVVKGSRVSPFDGYVVAVDGLTLVLSQNVEFTPGDEHSIILKRRDGSVQSVGVVPGHNDRTVIMTSTPQEAIYTGNSALKTEFSFGSEERHNAQMIVVSTVEPGSDRTVKITGYNYTDDYYAYDGVSPFGHAFSDGFSSGFL